MTFFERQGSDFIKNPAHRLPPTRGTTFRSASNLWESRMKSKLPMLPTNFVDPITGYLPRGEAQMSGLLGLFHQLNGVDWSRVPLLTTDNCPSGRMADDLLERAVICSEYQLFCNSESDINVWGSMPADLVCLSQDKQTVVLLENKIGSRFTGTRSDPLTGQLAKQADFLLHCQIPKAFLVLLSTRELLDNGMYRNALSNTLRHGGRSPKVSGYLMRWEDVLSALR
jgi:hypothetical protein